MPPTDSGARRAAPGDADPESGPEPGGASRWRIGVLASRVGVSETLLRAWELRYGLLDPIRTTSGYRLYGLEDERRIRAMVAARGRGVPAARAAAEVLAAERSVASPPAEDLDTSPSRTRSGLDTERALQDLQAAMVAYDVGSMHDTIDRALRAVSVEAVIRDVLLPFMVEVGKGWATGDFGIADEHFATEVIRARLAALTIGGDPRDGPLVLLSCPPGEAHDLALKAFEVVLQRAGWRTRYLGTQTPTRSLLAAAEVVCPDLVVLAATRRAAFESDDEALRELRGRWPLAIGGAGADRELAEKWGAMLLTGDPVSGAQYLVSQPLPTAAPPEAPTDE